jgi:acetamidase/formamidase
VDSITSTIHVRREQYHLAWNNSIAPIARIPSGGVIEFVLLDTAGGQIAPN